MATIKAGDSRIHPALAGLALLTIVALLIGLAMAFFAGTFTRVVPVTLTSDRSGLVMERGARVKMRGVEVGRVAGIEASRGGPVQLALDLDPDQLEHIPANVQAQIRATTAFGAKYVDLVYPEEASTQRITAGAVIRADNVSTEVNTVFQNLTELLDKVDPVKLNGVLTAVADGLRGEGPAVGEAITDANKVLLELNPRAENIRGVWHSVQNFSDTYSAAAQNILSVLDSASTTSTTITVNATALDSLLLGVLGLSNSGVDLLAPNRDNLATAVNSLESTTRLLLKYNPEFTCMIVGGKHFLDNGGYKGAGANGKSTLVDAAVLLGDDPYKYPANLPVIGAKGGPGGQPGCGSLPDVSQNWPVRQLVTNTGYGTGLDFRPNPGIGFPGFANYLPITRGTPQPPTIRNSHGGPAPGPIPYPGAPPYGAPQYAPDGTPLYPGLPPAPPPGAPREPGPPPPGSEPFVVPSPGAVQPTPLPPIPVPAAPSP